MNYKILPINEKPSIITCIHHAYPCAIIENKQLAYLHINDSNESIWEIDSVETSTVIDNSCISVVEKNQINCADSVLWKHCDNFNDISISVDYFKWNDLSGYIDIFLYNNNLKEEIGLEDKSCGIRWNPYGYFIKKEMYYYDTDIYTFIRFRKENDFAVAYASKNGIEWEKINEIPIPNDWKSKKLSIGIHMHWGKNYFDIWKKMNFIQLIYNDSNPYKGIFLDYYFFPRKNDDNSYGYYINFLNTSYELISDELDCFESVYDYIVWNINHKYYLVICLDEFYVQQRAAYNKDHYNHYNLFYGYDDIKKVYYVMGYGKNDTPIISEIPYSIIRDDIIMNNKVTKYKYSTNSITPLKFDIQSIILGLYEYVNNIDSSKKIANLLSEEKLLYGIDIIKELSNSKDRIRNVRHDKRIAYCLLEHSRLMKERIMFLGDNGYINELQRNRLVGLNEKTIQRASTLLTLVLKNQIKRIDDSLLVNSLIQLKNDEYDLCKYLLECLKSYIPTEDI